jgi:flagellar protein FlaG
MNTISNNSVVDPSVSEVNTKNNLGNIDRQNIEPKKTEQSQPVSVGNKDNDNVPKADFSVKQLEMVAQQLQDFVGAMSKSLEFVVDKDSGRDVIKVVDKTNGDVIKQYPSEEVLDLVSKLSEATGSFINEEV